MKWTVKEILAFAALVVASFLALWALIIPPEGVIDKSVLLAVAQFLVFSATMVGVKLAIDKMIEVARTKSE